MNRRQIFTTLTAGLVLLTVPACTAPNEAGPSADATVESTTLYLVRHAEKTAAASDPGLTEDGTRRAEALAERLEDAGVSAIYSTDYTRTQDTARPLAERLSLTVKSYDPSDLTSFAKTVQAEGGSILIVGHSNTTPQLVEALGGDGGTPITEATEYDRLYVLTLSDGGVDTDLQRYGVPTQ